MPTHFGVSILLLHGELSLSSGSFALPWGWGSLSAGSSGAVLSHSPPFVWALPPTQPIVHGWSTDNQRQKPQFAVQSPLEPCPCSDGFKALRDNFTCWCAASAPRTCSRMSPRVPQLLPSPGDLPPPTVSWGTLQEGTVPLQLHWDGGCGKSSQSGCWDLCRLCSYPCLCTVSMGGWGWR